jgi:hypothetical protein
MRRMARLCRASAASLPRRFMGPTRGSEGPLNQSVVFVYLICKSFENAINLSKKNNDVAAMRQRRDILCMQHISDSVTEVGSFVL